MDITLREPLDIVAIVKSTIVIPSKIVMLYKIISIPVKVLEPPTRIDPYIPSQKRMVNGFNNAISKPAKKECRKRMILRNFGSNDMVWSVSKFSIPVYIRTKNPKDHRNVFISGLSIN